MIWLAIKLLVKSWKFQKIHNRIIQRQLTNENDKEIPKKDMSPEKKQEIIDDLRLII